jgi:molecular chaperone HscB
VLLDKFGEIRAMNSYFEFYGIPESFNVEQAMLKKKFYELSKLYHPDFYAGEDESKQQEVLELSTLNNKAYQVLTDPARRMEYILKLHDLVSEGAKPQLPSDFLMEMMEINERLMEVDDSVELGRITAEILAIEGDMNEKLTKLTSDYSQLDHAAQQEKRIKIADIYYRQKYLLRIKESLDTFAARL